MDLPTTEPNLTFNIEESKFEEIAVSGNNKSKDYVILGEIDIKPGDEVNEKELRKNLSRVYNLNYFSEVVPDICLLNQQQMRMIY